MRTNVRVLKSRLAAVVHVPAGREERSTEKDCSLVELSTHERRAEVGVISVTERLVGGLGVSAEESVSAEIWAESSESTVPLKAWTR